MRVCPIISFAFGLRLLFAATIIVCINFGASVTDVRGQTAIQQQLRTAQPPAALPNLSPLRSADSRAKPVQLSESATQIPPSLKVARNLGDSTHPSWMPNFFLMAPNAPVDPQPQTQQTAPDVNQRGTPVNWDAPVNPVANLESYPTTDYPAISETVQGMANENAVEYDEPAANQIPYSNDAVHLGNSYFETPATDDQVIVDQTTSVLPSVPPIYVLPANRSGNDSGLLSAYHSRSFLQSGDEFQVAQSSKLPQDYQPWWAQENQNPIGLKASPLQVSLDSLIQRALANSPHIQVAATQPHIQQAVLLEESSRFDWMAFLESTYDDQNEPVGNSLTLGNNATRLSQQQWTSEGGIRRQTRTGGEFELSQSFGTFDNNSTFLIPPDQGNSRIVLNYRQPLLRGRGRAVNESLIVLANIGLNAASDEFLTEIQQHLTDLTETYWELVRARSELLQRSKLLIEAEKILTQLEGRSAVDALERQVFRARSAVAKRKAEIARSVTSVKNAESRIRLLVNDQQIINAAKMELVPVDVPNIEHLGINLGDAISTALANRSDISRSIREVKATSVQLGIARNDLLPKLDLLVGSYVAGLDDQFDIAGAWRNQFSDGRPGFNIGFEFETAIGNRAAQARQSRRTWEANRAMHQFRAVVESGLTEVELAVREVETAHQEMNGRYHAMIAAQKESSFLADRWETLPDENDSVVLLLENLLDSQERLVNEEAAFSKAQFDYSVAVVKLKQATGTLFQVN